MEAAATDRFTGAPYPVGKQHSGIMWSVVIALLPAAVAGWFFWPPGADCHYKFNPGRGSGRSLSQLAMGRRIALTTGAPWLPVYFWL